MPWGLAAYQGNKCVWMAQGEVILASECLMNGLKEKDWFTEEVEKDFHQAVEKYKEKPIAVQL